MIIFPTPGYQTIQELKTIFLQFDRWCHGYHLDFMDSHFVPHTAASIELINQAQQCTSHPLWVHLMTFTPEKIMAQLRLKKNSIISVHFEASSVPQLIQQANKIARMNMHSSLAINPETDLSMIVDILPFFDQILVMSVEPGASGQTFIPETVQKIKTLKLHIEREGLQCSLAVDGGVNAKTMPHIIQAGADSCAMSSALFDHNDPLTIFQDYLKQ